MALSLDKIKSFGFQFEISSYHLSSSLVRNHSLTLISENFVKISLKCPNVCNKGFKASIEHHVYKKATEITLSSLSISKPFTLPYL